MFLLILGGRYGSLEPESGKSYIHLEYEYALEQVKPLFAVVITEGCLEAKSKEAGLSVVERDHQAELSEFRSLVTSKMVRLWDDPKDIKLAVHEKLNELLRDKDLVGQIPGTETVDTAPLAAEIARLGKENADLRDQLEQASKSMETYNGLTFDEIYNFLLQIEIPQIEVSEEPDEKSGDISHGLNQILRGFGDDRIGLIHLLWYWKEELQLGRRFSKDAPTYAYALKLEELDLVDVVHSGSFRDRRTLTASLNQTGKRFLLRLQTVRDVGPLEKYVSKATPN